MFEVSIIHTDGRREHTVCHSRTALVILMGEHGSEFTGDNTNKFQRPELQGLPRFSKAVGPMWQGSQGQARYEMDLRPTEQVNTDGTKAFVAGRTYTTRSIVDADHVISITIKRRTAKTIVTTEGKTLRIGMYEGVEYVKPWGSYSMAPIVRAAR